jgi:hypothetical protein
MGSLKRLVGGIHSMSPQPATGEKISEKFLGNPATVMYLNINCFQDYERNRSQKYRISYVLLILNNR